MQTAKMTLPWRLLVFGFVLVLSVFFIERPLYALEGHHLAKAKITEHEVGFSATPLEEMPVEVRKIKKEKKGGFRWGWVLLGVVAVGAGVALAGGGGSSGGGGGGTGDISVSW